jgi:NADH-quinone oxidoreductase subunit N
MNSDLSSFASLAPAYPELLLAVGVVVLLLAGVLFSKDRSTGIAFLSIILLVAVTAVAIWQPAEGVLFNGGFIVDGFARYMKFLVLGGSAFALVLSTSTAKPMGLDKFEYSILVLLATLGMMVMVSANDLMSLYVGLELQSLALYVVAALKREDPKATEAGLKYFVLGALSSGMLLYGASLIYGFTGMTQLDQIVGAIAGERSIGLIFGMVFLIAGIAFKISAVPFHMWTPDVYEGAPTPVTAFFAAAPKVAAMALMIRVVTVPFGGVGTIHDWQQIVIFLSIASMVLAAFAAIGQNNLKRLLAYSSIGHVGFALVGLSAGTQPGVEGVAVYMAIYIVMTLCMFAALLALRTQSGYVETIPQLAGLAQKKPFVAAIIAIVMFSFIGLPPLAGFFAKWQVFLAAIDAQLFALAIIGVLASAVSAFYYLRIIKVMYFDEPQSEFVAVPAELTAVMAVAGFFIVTYFVTVGSPLYNAAHAAAGSLF